MDKEIPREKLFCKSCGQRTPKEKTWPNGTVCCTNRIPVKYTLDNTKDVKALVEALQLISEAPKTPYLHTADDHHKGKTFEFTNYSVVKVAKKAIKQWEGRNGK